MQPTTAVANSKTLPTGSPWRAALRSPLVAALGALLAAQLVATLLLGFLGGDRIESAGSRGPLLDIERDQVTSIRIAVPEQEPVLVTRAADGWRIPALQDLPAAEHKVTALLSKLEALEKGLPVGTSAAALKRFKVAEDSFERKLSLEGSAGVLASLYLGDSAGFRRLFVRADGDNSVYEAEIGLFDAPQDAVDWSDRAILHLKTEDIKQLRLEGLTLDRSDDSWRLADLAEGDEQDTEAIEDLVRRLSSMDFVSVLGPEEKPAVNQDISPVEVEATMASDETVRFRIFKLEEGDEYLLEVSNRPQRFTLAAYAAEDLLDIDRTRLLKEPELPAEGSSESAPPPTAATDDDSDPATEMATATDVAPAAQAPAADGESLRLLTPDAAQTPASESDTPVESDPE